MSEKLFTNDIDDNEEKGWAELDDIAEQATEIIQMDSGSLVGRNKIEQMIVAITEKRKDILWQLADDNKFQYHNRIFSALNLLK
jgi:hypothetical protein